MPALNFQARWADSVRTGRKRQTIRAPRKDGRDPKPGDTLYLYTGMRTKACRLLAVRRCRSARRVKITKHGVMFPFDGDQFRAGTWRADEFARADGFADFDEMLGWFREHHGLPFRGFVIHWHYGDLSLRANK